MRSYDPPLPVRVRAAPDGRPQAFVWDGVTHAVESIEGVREPRLDWWAAEGEQHRRYFLVVTTTQGPVVELELERDETSGARGVARRQFGLAPLWASSWATSYLSGQLSASI